MTKEIALYCMKAYSQHHNEICEECPIYGQTGDDHCFEDALQYVINHFDVLDKIRAEISDFEEEVFHRPNTDYSDYAAVRHCLEIIDHYREGENEKNKKRFENELIMMQTNIFPYKGEQE